MIERYAAFERRTVAFDAEEGKWSFNGRHYKRKGQAETAAWKFWRKHNE